MQTEQYLTYGWFGVTAAVIAGKWALDLGLAQWEQVLWMIAGLILPPVALLALYVRLIRRARTDNTRRGLSRGVADA